MLVLRQEINSFISTNLTQPRPEWSDASTYDYQDEVTYKNHVYRSMIDGNVNVNPALNTGKWLLWEVDNSFAAIDLHSLTNSYIDDGLTYIEYKFNADGFDTVVLRGVYGLTIDLLEYDSGDVLLRTQNVSGIPERTSSDSWYNYYFSSISSEADLFPMDMIFQTIQVTTSYIILRINKRSNGMAYISTLAGGRSYDIGAAKFGLEGGFIDYSLRDTDNNGITKITKRNVRETMKADLVMDSVRTQQIKRFVKSCMGDVVIFVADPSIDSRYENLTMLGYITDFNIKLANPAKSYGEIEIEESL